MRVTKKELKRIIENYLIEQESSTSSINSKASKIADFVAANAGTRPALLPDRRSKSDPNKVPEELPDRNVLNLDDAPNREQYIYGEPTYDKVFEKALANARSKNPELFENDPKSYLEFDGQYLHWYSGGSKKLFSWPAVSGRTEAAETNPESKTYEKRLDQYKDRVELSKVPDAMGPTPEGVWLLGSPAFRDMPNWKSETKTWLTKAGYKLQRKGVPGLNLGPRISSFSQSDHFISKRGWGNLRVNLEPAPETETYGRTSMYIHGGDVPGSAGCIDLVEYAEDFGKLYALWKLKWPGIDMKLKIKYTKPGAKTKRAFKQKNIAGSSILLSKDKKKIDDILNKISSSKFGIYSTKTAVNTESKKDVALIQTLLSELGYLTASDIDGGYGPSTESAVKDFQKDNKLGADGKVGPETMKKMIELVE